MEKYCTTNDVCKNHVVKLLKSIFAWDETMEGEG